MVQKPEKTLTAKAVGREFVRQVKMIMNSNDLYSGYSNEATDTGSLFF